MSLLHKCDVFSNFRSNLVTVCWKVYADDKRRRQCDVMTIRVASLYTPQKKKGRRKEEQLSLSLSLSHTHTQRKGRDTRTMPVLGRFPGQPLQGRYPRVSTGPVRAKIGQARSPYAAPTCPYEPLPCPYRLGTGTFIGIKTPYARERSCSPCQSSVYYGNIQITQHTLKVSESSSC